MTNDTANAIVAALGDTPLDRKSLHALAAVFDEFLVADGPGFGIGTDAPISRFRSPRQFEAEIVKLCGGYGSTPKADDGHPAPCFKEAVGFHLLSTAALLAAGVLVVYGALWLMRTSRPTDSPVGAR